MQRVAPCFWPVVVAVCLVRLAPFVVALALKVLDQAAAAWIDDDADFPLAVLQPAVTDGDPIADRRVGLGAVVADAVLRKDVGVAAGAVGAPAGP